MEDAAEKLNGKQQRSSMKQITAEGMSYSVMSGLGDAYIPAAVLALGASNFYAGLIVALPQFFGALMQFVSLTALRMMKNRKILVMAGTLAHALTWLPIMGMMFWPNDLSIPLITLFFSIGAGMSLFINPAWSSWVSDIVPENERGRFFANRNRLMQTTVFITTFFAGVMIRQMQLQYSVGIAFGAVFAVAFFARLYSVIADLRTRDVKYELSLMHEIQMKHLFLLPAHRNELWFLVFVALMSFAVQFASPFFTPFILNELGYDVGVLGFLTAVSVITKIVAYPYWGKIVDRFGNRAVLITGAFMSPIIPFIWLFSGELHWLIVFQAFSGFIWAGYDLAVFNYALSLVSRDLRPSFMSKYNIFTGFSFAAGAIAGALFLVFFPTLAIFGFSGILLVFLLSTVMRLAVAIAFTPNITSGREVLNTSQERGMVFDLVAIYPTQGAVMQALGGWNFTRKAVRTTRERGTKMIKTGLEATADLARDGKHELMSRISRKKRL